MDPKNETIASMRQRVRSASSSSEDEKSVDGWLSAALKAYQANDLVQSAVLLERAVDISPNDAAFRYSYATVLYDLDRFEDALDHHLAAERIMSESGEPEDGTLREAN